MVACLDSDRLERLERDVRRVAEQHVDGAVEVGERLGHVAVAQVDAGAGEVALGPDERVLTQLDGVHLCLGHLGRDAQCDRTRARAEVDDDRPGKALPQRAQVAPHRRLRDLPLHDQLQQLGVGVEAHVEPRLQGPLAPLEDQKGERREEQEDERRREHR